MAFIYRTRRVAFAILTIVAIATGALSASIVFGALTPAAAQISEDAQIALEDYGSWRPHPRFGQVWVPAAVPPDWRPYEYGHWVYTDEWGWYWVSDDVEANWGWVVYHYGRWAFERGFGWFWVPGDEWAPAWVNWRYGDEYVGWAPLPPEDFGVTYESEPAYWVFVPGRYMAAPRVRTYIVPVYRRTVILRSTRVVNRTFPVHGARLAVNPGISPAFVARVSGAPVATYRVRPRVFASTQGVSGALQVRREELRGPRPGGPGGPGTPAGRTGAAAPRLSPISVQRTTNVIQPSAAVTAPQALGQNEPGRLGTHPPRAAQGAAPPITPPTTPQPSPLPPPASQRQAPTIPQQAPGGTPSPPPSVPPASTTAPTNAAPVQRQEFRERVAPGGPAGGSPPQQPNIVRPTPPQAPPPPSPPVQQRQVQPPPPPLAPPPPQQRQVQPPPPPSAPPPPQLRQVQPPPPPSAPPPPQQRQMQPPPPPAARVPGPPQGPPPKKPPPKPGEKPDEKK